MAKSFKVKYGCAVVLMALCSCYPNTKITGSWKSPGLAKNYHSVFVIALTANTVSRSTIEQQMSEALARRGLQGMQSLQTFPPGFSGDSLTREKFLSTVKEKKADAILIVSMQKKETEARYVSGSYSPMSRYDYYGSFGGYYNHWHPYASSPGYYQETDIYYLESNLYDSANELLVWSAQSRTYSYDDLTGLAKEFSAIVVERMAKDGVLK